MFRTFFSSTSNIFISLFFVLYFLVGLQISKDYGVNWDDADQHQNGLNNWAYLFENKPEFLRKSIDRYHGPAFEIILIAVEKWVGYEDFRRVFITRHDTIFIYFFGSVCAFFFVLKSLFKKNSLAFLGCLLLISSPRIFAESFYNPKDITFLSAMIFCFFSFVKYIETEKLKWAILHGFTLAFAMDIRIFGFIFFPITLFFLGLNWLQGAHIQKPRFAHFIAFIFSFSFISICFWPILQDNPILHFQQAYIQLSNYTIWGGSNLFFGQSYLANQTPGIYQLAWFLLTTPILITFLFIVGIFFLVKNLHLNFLSSIFHLKYILLSLVLFIFPITIMWMKHSVVLDGWRHVYFIFPFFIVVAVFGYSQLQPNFSSKLLLLLTTGYLCFQFFYLYKLHPYQYSYFNILSNLYLKPIEEKFEMDYWGVSYKQLLEELVRKEYKNKPLVFCVKNTPGRLNYDFLPESMHSKLILTNNYYEADYYLTNHRFENANIPGKLICSITSQGNKLSSVYKIKD